LITLTGILIPYSVQFFIKDLTPQKFLIIALFPIVLVFLMFQKKTGKYAELFLTAYMIAIIAILTTAYQDLLPQQNQNESFYTGYSFAMIIRLLGYNLVSLRYSVIIFLVQIPLKFSLVQTSDALQIIIVLALDLATIGLRCKSEVVEIGSFELLYKMKKDMLKFKHLLTQYIPNQIAIFANHYSTASYANTAFKITFKVRDLSFAKGALERLLIEPETVERNKRLFENLGLKNLEDRDVTIDLSTFMNTVALNTDLLHDIGLVSFPVIEEEYALRDISPKNESVRRISFSAEAQRPNEKKNGTMMNQNETRKYIDRRTKLDDSDIVYEYERRRIFKLKIFPLFWDDSEALGIIMEDVTSQREIMELKIADKNRDMMVPMVSHELRTPLNGMLGLLDIARKNIKEPETLSYLQACRNTGLLTLNLVNSILDMNQIKNKRLRLVYLKFSLLEFLHEIKDLFSYFCRVKNLNLNVEIDANVPKMITTDKSRLSQILLNLLGNAFKFTFQGGVTLRVSLECARPTQVKFYVKDTGIGIRKEDQERLLKMLSSSKQQGWKIHTQGLGLGLTISNTLAELLNPTENKGICIESEVDVGTCFSFVIEPQDPETSSLKEDGDGTSEELNEEALHSERSTNILHKMNAYANDNFKKLANVNLDENNITPTNPTNESQRKLLKPNHASLHHERISEIDEEQEYSADNKMEKPWCLIADDNPFCLMVISHMMEERGYQVKTARNGEEAVNQFKDHEVQGFIFKLTLMDCQMPVMDGFEATKIIKELMKNGELHESPIFAITANFWTEEHDKLCRSVGMNGHLAKPLQVSDLDSILKKIQM